MVYGLPAFDEPNWNVKLDASITAVKATADAAAAKANNLSDLANPATARTNLGLGNSATQNTGTATGTVAAGDDARITGAAQKASNLSDLANATTARTNLGLGTAATKNTGTGAGAVPVLSGAPGTPDGTKFLRDDGTWATTAAAWQSYTPTWTATTGTPAVGSTGGLSGAYMQSGKTVTFRLNLVLAGTGISVGTGAWAFGLPVAHVTAPTGIVKHGVLLGGYFEDLSVQGYVAVGGQVITSTTFTVLYSDTAGAGRALPLGAAAPFAWGNGDYLSIYGTYQAA